MGKGKGYGGFYQPPKKRASVILPTQGVTNDLRWKQIEENIKKQVYRDYGDDAALEIARREGYDEGANYYRVHAINLNYIAMCDSLHRNHGFGRQRLMSLCVDIDKSMGKAIDRIQAGEDPLAVEVELRDKLAVETGFRIDLLVEGE